MASVNLVYLGVRFPILSYHTTFSVIQNDTILAGCGSKPLVDFSWKIICAIAINWMMMYKIFFDTFYCFTEIFADAQAASTAFQKYCNYPRH